MNLSSVNKFLHRVRIHDGECGAVARALHHEAKEFSLPAVFENVSNTTKERKLMSTKTYFKRISLVVVAALGMGVLATSSGNAAYVANSASLTLSSATASVSVGETATTTLTAQFVGTVNTDSLVLTSTCSNSTGAACSTTAVAFYWTKTADSNTGTTIGVQTADGTMNRTTEYISNGQNAVATVRAVLGVKAVIGSSANLGTYTYTISGKSPAANSDVVATATFTVTVTAGNLTPASLTTYLAPTGAQARYWKEFPGGVNASSKDSSVTKATVASDASSPVAAAYIYANALNSSSETITALGKNICSDSTLGYCAVTVEVTGSGLVATGADGSTAPTAASATKTASLRLYNDATADSDSREVLAVYADGTPGTGTIKFYGAGRTLLATNTITFTGASASAVITGVSDSSVAVGNTSTISAIVRDSGPNALTTGTVYVYASDTKVVTTGATSTNATQYTQLAAGVRGNTSNACTTYSTTTSRWTCDVTVGDTGTATIVLRDSWTVAASTWVSNEITLTGLGNTAAAFTVAFDKSSYNAGEAAVLTITGTDLAGRAVSNGTAGTGLTLTSITSSLGFGNGAVTTAGTQAVGTSVTSTTFKGYTVSTVESGIETRAVVMPSTSGTLTYTIKYTPANSTTETTASASVTIVDPAEVAAKAAIAAAKAAETAAVAAADAATDAALQAIDAANAATDAANLAAEAADAATVAAEEAKDAADSATAAVEALATQVATLMAALQAQVRSLANTVAKIAKKVQA